MLLKIKWIKIDAHEQWIKVDAHNKFWKVVQLVTSKHKKAIKYLHYISSI